MKTLEIVGLSLTLVLAGAAVLQSYVSSNYFYTISGDGGMTIISGTACYPAPFDYYRSTNCVIWGILGTVGLGLIFIGVTTSIAALLLPLFRKDKWDGRGWGS